MSDKIVILGSGIIGLYTAYILSKQAKGPETTVIAEFLPGDQSINYTSPWAGANFSCISGDDPVALEYDRISFGHLEQFRKEVGSRAGIKRLPTTEYFDHELAPAKLESLKSYIPDLKIVPKHQLPDGAKFGIIYTTFNFNSPRLLKFLQQHLTAQGVTFVRRRVDNLQDAFLSPSTKVLFNCTGIGARNLGGLEDPNVYPIRGQVVVVRAPNVQENRSIFDDHSITYIIPRPDSGGHVICGGFYQENDWTADTFSWATESIIERTTQLMPELRRADGTVEIIRECAGLRPARKGGARIEKELISDGRAIIHNYGAAGTGYQSGYAMALKAVSLLRDTKL